MQIALIEKDAAPDPVRRLYEGLEHAGRPVGNFHKVLAHKPDVLRAWSGSSSSRTAGPGGLRAVGGQAGATEPPNRFCAPWAAK